MACRGLFLTGLPGGDAEAEDEALAVLRAEHASMACSLLTWAVTGVLDSAAIGSLTVPSSAPLVPAEVLSELAGLGHGADRPAFRGRVVTARRFHTSR